MSYRATIFQMKYYIKYNISQACRAIIEEQLLKMELLFSMDDIGEVNLQTAITAVQFKDMNSQLAKYGIEMVDNQKSKVVNQIKDLIHQQIFSEKNRNTKFSIYLSEKLNHSYSYLANLFSEVTCTSIENFFIMQKIERVKQLLIEDQETLSHIADSLDYSSVAHLSTQFKKTTGLTPTMFQRILKKRKHVQMMK